MFTVFDGVDAILHGGDIHELFVLDQLAEVAPLWSARGNGEDGSAGRPIAPDDDRLRYSWLLDLAGVRVGLTHDVPMPELPPNYTVERWKQRRFGTTDIDVLVYGDSHVERIDVVGPTAVRQPGLADVPAQPQHPARHDRLPRDRRRPGAGLDLAADRRRHGGPTAELEVPASAMTYENLLVETDGPVATITLNRPEQLNAMSTGLLDDLFQALRDLNPGDDVRVIRLRGAGRAFCPGYDLVAGLGLLGVARDRHRRVDGDGTWPTSASRRSPVTASRCAR